MLAMFANCAWSFSIRKSPSNIGGQNAGKTEDVLKERWRENTKQNHQQAICFLLFLLSACFFYLNFSWVYTSYKILTFYRLQKKWECTGLHQMWKRQCFISCVKTYVYIYAGCNVCATCYTPQIKTNTHYIILSRCLFTCWYPCQYLDPWRWSVSGV